SESPPWHARESRSEDCDRPDGRPTNRLLLQTLTEIWSTAPGPPTHPVTTARVSPARSTPALRTPASPCPWHPPGRQAAPCPNRPATAGVASDTIDRPAPDTGPCIH